MNWRTTWVLFSLALLLFGFIYFFERHFTSGAAAQEGPRRLMSVRPADIQTLQFRRTNQFVLKVERAKEGWNLTAPVNYPAQVFAVETLLKALTEIASQTYIAPGELTAGRQTVAEFGLDVPLAAVTLMEGSRRHEISFGRKTPPGDQVYVQVLGSPGIHVVGAEIFDQLPRLANHWRDSSLVTLVGLGVDRFEMRSANRGFAISVNPTNSLYYLSRPTSARADREKVNSLLHKAQTAQILRFVTDDAATDSEQFGFAKPEAELVFGVGTNDAVVVQFGSGLNTSTDTVYARRMSHPNVVMLVPRSVLESLQVSAADLRDRRLFSFPPNEVDTLAVTGSEPFATRRQNNGAWILIDPDATLLDTELIHETLKFMLRVQGNVEKDLVTDFAPYGLAEPARRFLLQRTVTNSAGSLTNLTLAQLDIGARQGDKIFVRRPDEGHTVYSISTDDFYRLPSSAWQLRDRRVWSFSTNQVTRLTIKHEGKTREFLRNGAGDWSLAPGSTGVIKPPALEELAFQLGQLRAYLWIGRGEESRARFGFTPASSQISVEIKVAEKPHSLVLDFGAFSPVSKLPYASTQIDGQAWVFEFPADLFWRIQRDLFTPLRMAGTL